MIRENERQAMRAFKAEGHTREEVAKKYGVSLGTVTKICRGIAPQRLTPEESRKLTQQQHERTRLIREEKAKEQVAALGFEYVCGYSMTDSFVTIRCPRCGEVFQRSMVTIRHGRATQCPGCIRNEKAKKEKVDEDRKAQLEAERKAAKEERERRKKEEAEIKRQSRIHECPVCGQLTTEKKYCSKECANKAQNARREMRRRIRINGALVDKDITLQKLYNRDHGICYLCGKECDWDDKEERNGTIICGNDYPSIEHVVPLSRGGEHSWENVKLACRGCNTKKHTSLLTTIFSPTISA